MGGGDTSRVYTEGPSALESCRGRGTAAKRRKGTRNIMKEDV